METLVKDRRELDTIAKVFIHAARVLSMEEWDQIWNRAPLNKKTEVKQIIEEALKRPIPDDEGWIFQIVGSKKEVSHE
jgi:hypothetical protein